ncbi:unnamed protein product [Rotaria magnacalcarata]|uniref:Uncharacterized protein n=2 Tax=Rotaria magnacalcarata TaxID=392030 RepID=A0A819JHX4_9BILA|nr:unnamed protein product [Rotaria magnacalcarata]CAF3930363.1 unnamed protein product [Rotaria magnacalcarata]
MSRFLTVENLPSYMCQIRSIVASLLCDHTRMKCIYSSSSFEFFSCPIRFIEEVEIIHPYHSLVIDTLETFHKKYDGCSCKTLLFFLVTFSNHFHLLFDKNNRFSQKTIFNHLEQFVGQSILIAKENFTDNLVLNLDVFHRICRFQTMYSDSLYQAYLYFVSLQEELINQFDNLNHITRVKYAEEQCLFIPGTIIPIDKPIQGYQRTLLIDGYVLEDYVHIGYNNKLKLKQISAKSSWIYVISSILNQYSIDIILCSGTIDEKLKDLNRDNKRIFVENISSKIFRLFNQNLIVNYVTDINEENILTLNYIQSNDDPTLIFIEKGSTIIQYVPIESLVNIKHEQFVHCLARFRHILRKKFYLKGSGEFEHNLYKYFYGKKNESLSIEYNLAYECFLECLQLFSNEIFNRKELFEKNLIDDFDSKFDAWQTSIELLKILMQVNDVVQIVDNEDLSDI